MMSRALGNAYVKDPRCSITNLYKPCRAIIAKPTLYSFALDPCVPKALLLVSDGITNHLSTEGMTRVVKEWNHKSPRHLASSILVQAG